MALDGKILRRALDRYEEANRRRSEDTRRLRGEIYAKDERIGELDRLLRASVAEAAALALRGGDDPERAVAAIQEKNLSWQDERAKRIAALGYPRGCIDEEPACPLCGDRGYVGTKPCSCLMKLYREEQRKELSRLLDLQGESFDAFQLRYYDAFDPVTGTSPRRHMESVRQVCRKFAENFTPGSGSLFLTGAPGLGKTFLSACIARVVSERGYSVVYDSVANIFARFETRRFAPYGEESRLAGEDTQRYLACDLLIMDDLGTEFLSPFFQSVLYELVNTRLVEGKSTVISTNLDKEGLRKRYAPQVVSRIEGNYSALPFFGRDIRQRKKDPRL